MTLPRLSRPLALACASLFALAVSTPALAQRSVPLNAAGIPTAPQGLANLPFGDGPFDYPTGEGQDIRVEVLTKGLNQPYAIAFLPDGTMLITEQAGRIRVVRNGRLDPAPVPGGPAAYWPAERRGATLHGYQNIALHPNFAQNRQLYLSYTKALSPTEGRFAVARATWTPQGLTEVKDIWQGDAKSNGALPIAFGGDGMLYIGVSGGDAQDTQATGGKVMRIRDDGSTPPDNPFVGKAGYLPQIYSLGHRNLLSLAAHPKTGEIWATENGPNGGDELNLIKAGKNYGWPLVSLGRTYPGPWQSKIPTHEGYEAPVVYWTPAIAAAGLTFYTGDKLSKWTGDVFVSGLRVGEIPGTGRIDRILFNENMEEMRRETLLGELHQRIRDVKAGPDGFIYALTDSGALLRIGPR